MKTKTNKKISTIVLTAMLVISVFAAFVTPAAAGEGQPTNDIVLTNFSVHSCLLGQTLSITGAVDGVAFLGKAGAAEDHFFAVVSDDLTKIDTIAYDMKTGSYELAYDDGEVGSPALSTLYVNNPRLNIETQLDTEAVTTTTQGTNLTFVLDSNIDGLDYVKITFTGPDGVPVTATYNEFGALVDRSDITKNDANALLLYTEYFALGTWTIDVETIEETAQGLEASATATLEVISPTVALAADKTAITASESVGFTITGPVEEDVTVNVNPDTEVEVVQHAYEFVGYIHPADGVIYTGVYAVEAPLEGCILPKIGTDSKLQFALKFTDDGTYTVKAEIDDESESVDIVVSKGAVTVSAPTQAIIGEKVDITGTATGTTQVTVVISDSANIIKEIKKDTTLVDDEYKVTWETSNLLPGTYRIHVYGVDQENLGDDVAVNASTDEIDISAGAAASLRLIEGDLVVNVPSVTAEEDTGDMKVEGTATGASVVYMLVFRNDNGACQFAEPVTVKSDDWSFEEMPLLPTATKGTYTVFVIHPGRDSGVGDDLVKPETYEGKTLAQITSLVEYWSIGQPGSDDMLVSTTFKVEKDTVTISPVADVGVGATLTIEATTNRAEGKLATVTLTGPDGTIALASTEVTDGEVTADFDTTDFALGVWEVEVDADGTVETTTVNILEAAPTPTPTVTPTPTPTVTPTVTPPTPGFEAVFAIAGLLAVAYLVLRREE